MSNILDTIAEYARRRVEADRGSCSLEEMKAGAMGAGPADGQAFYDAVSKSGMSFICEVKKASPSKGVIDPIFDHMTIAREYEAAGADCVSCLTEPKWFLGSDDIFREIRASIPASALYVAESGVKTARDAARMRSIGADAVLMGEVLMRAADKGAMLALMREAAK